MIPVDRRKTVPVNVGGVTIGGDAPIVVQSMTNTDTADVASTVDQVKLLADAGSQLVRVTVIMIQMIYLNYQILTVI